MPAAVEHHLLFDAELAVDGLRRRPRWRRRRSTPVAGLPRARLVPRLGAAGGGVKPSLKDGGTFAAPVPQLLGLPPIVKASVAPSAISA